MKIIALEEHLVTSEVLAAWRALPAELRDIAVGQSTGPKIQQQLFDYGDARLRDMDACGVDVQVLSLTTPGVQSLDPAQAVRLAQATNDVIAAMVKQRPDRFAGFATLPTPSPDDAVRELERAVRDLGLHGAMICGRTRDRNADHADFLPIYETAARLRVPLYLHPQSPRPAVRAAYYDGFDDKLSSFLATGGIGWHYETGVQVLRLVLSGVFDRYPDLQLILGHWGEVVLFYLERVEMLTPLAKASTGLKRPVTDYFRTNISVTPSGMFSKRYLHWATEVLGVERILFATDYPYLFEPDGAARRFLENSGLPAAEQEAIGHGNWERLVAGIRR